MARLVAIRLAPMWSFCACQDHQPAIAATTSDAPAPRAARQRNQLRNDIERPVRRTFVPSGFVMRTIEYYSSFSLVCTCRKRRVLGGTQEIAAAAVSLDRRPDRSEMRKGRFRR